MNTNQDRRVFVVLGLYRPDPVLFSRQLESLVTQTHRNLEILICPDGVLSSEIRAVANNFSKFPVHILAFEERVGIHANFARGLREAVAAGHNDSDLFAFCDQDDFWHRNKLERQLRQFVDPQTSLCHSDARVVSREGDLIKTSLFELEARSHSMSFHDLLIMNSVTGMTAVFRRDVAKAVEPFPLSGCGYILHDHWTALVASLLGTIRFIDEPLVDYTQHSGNAMGARVWRGRLQSGNSFSARRAYPRKCYRQFAWRLRALSELRNMLGHVPDAEHWLFGKPVRALFDCDSGRSAGLVLSLQYRLRGRRRQADQIWRIWRGLLLHCGWHNRLHRQQD